ncbi:hypothetical protein COCC4DRAFT_188283 [Bipolaris maydis ATCC 48331]|uniref:Secreted protein n=2 Tax=Cochliobolus heterostrophus TaxID=5016 RepID=M2UCY9_COCH5|nr:uncharacterized protein COCC4DRAFT_188283 [Bipolaris maydis ATCC 48331]EMD91571.1 hypothetical protein COCHEDRAFT_1194352 [Bipolaris maydis C5]ENI08672.1 hypothetical protein COCC4DRAFT_188283 [Bipolaris maydis ATCC 48331]
MHTSPATTLPLLLPLTSAEPYTTHTHTHKERHNRSPLISFRLAILRQCEKKTSKTNRQTRPATNRGVGGEETDLVGHRPIQTRRILTKQYERSVKKEKRLVFYIH